jgi:hypothetical protein
LSSGGNSNIGFANTWIASSVHAGPWLAMCFAIALCPTSNFAYAHHQRASQNTSGMPIPNITHGQGRTISEYRSAILDLAARQINPDAVSKRLLNFANVQYTYCLWGLMPGSLSDESSPFNECTHAYLAATKALLMHLRDVADDRAVAQDLAAKINIAMMRDRSSLQLCRNSFDSFNTAQVIYPDWSTMHVANLVMLALQVLALGVVAYLVITEFKRPKIARKRSRTRQKI